MKKILKYLIIGVVFIPLSLFAQIKGIYLTQNTAENTARVEYMIKNAKAVGISTFVVDYVHPNKHYSQNVQLIKENDIRYVARIVIFPEGGTPVQVSSKEYLSKRLALINQAIELGADEIQLDYIRYKASQRPSPQNAENIAEVIRYFKANIDPKIPLQVDVFGIATIKPSIYIGQNLPLFAKDVDAINPMVYPSHFEPYRIHARQPYKTVYDSIISLKKQIEPSDVKIHVYIELFNYRYPMNQAARESYINAQLKAVADSGADGWYAWSASNRYDILFNVLRQSQSLASNDV